MLRFNFFLLAKSLRSANFFTSDTTNIEDVRPTKKRRSEMTESLILRSVIVLMSTSCRESLRLENVLQRRAVDD